MTNIQIAIGFLDAYYGFVVTSGFNRGGQVDSQRRYIYLHGSPPVEPMGVPMSHGCIRLRPADVCELADQMKPGTLVSILES